VLMASSASSAWIWLSLALILPTSSNTCIRTCISAT
jgi:hypothetical protein